MPEALAAVTTWYRYERTRTQRPGTCSRLSRRTKVPQVDADHPFQTGNDCGNLQAWAPCWAVSNDSDGVRYFVTFITAPSAKPLASVPSLTQKTLVELVARATTLACCCAIARAAPPPSGAVMTAVPESIQ
jgi:hypothetical protein